MNKPNTDYVGNLEFFLQYSDENEVDSDTFLREFSKKDSLKWLDVGAGPGTKPIRILKKGLINQCSVKLDILEPSEEWMRILTDNFERNGLTKLIRRKYSVRWEDFNESKRYDLLTFFHSVYGIDIESLSKIPDFLKENGCACIVVESPNSHLHQIKRELFPYVHHKELVSSSNTIASFLDSKGLKYRISGEEPQRFYVDELLDKTNPQRIIPLSFILQTRPEDHDKLASSEIQEKLDEALGKFVKKDDGGKHYIETPDRFIWVYN